MPEINTIRCYVMASEREVEILQDIPESIRFPILYNIASIAIIKLSKNSEYKQIS
jgi:hypothetical protein